MLQYPFTWEHMMSFPDNLANLRRYAQLTQRELSERSGCSLQQLKNYEAGRNQPTLDVIKRLSVALSVTADQLIFDPAEREPQSDALRILFLTIGKFPKEDQKTVISLLDAFVKRHRFEEMMNTTVTG